MSKEQCINNWREMHEGNSYFLKHPHYVGLHLNSGNIAQEIDSYVGLFFEDDVLEIGCGYGRLMSALTQQVKSVTGVDLHNAPLAVAREMHADKSNLRFVQNDGFSLPFKDNNFDLVYSFSAFQHMPREVVASYVKESIRVLRFGGRFCLQFLSAVINSAGLEANTAEL